MFFQKINNNERNKKKFNYLILFSKILEIEFFFNFYVIYYLFKC